MGYSCLLVGAIQPCKLPRQAPDFVFQCLRALHPGRFPTPDLQSSSRRASIWTGKGATTAKPFQQHASDNVHTCAAQPCEETPSGQHHQTPVAQQASHSVDQRANTKRPTRSGPRQPCNPVLQPPGETERRDRRMAMKAMLREPASNSNRLSGSGIEAGLKT